MVHASKRLVSRLAVIATLALVPVVVGACGAATHYLGQKVLHAAANRLITSASGRRKVDKLFCLDNAYYAFKDIRHGHYLFGALTAEQALKNCEAGFKKNARP